ncbi:retropepsin-like aspartic protease [Brachymonas sp. G13]|uniref:retropepsin-like aspartic protease family protein n=1 Tax=Brachymonas TaxID=28219 RepID=UPI00169656DA|nr:retropepsin-like aspartic protease [Brachymonas sp. J145]MEE1654376.1 retropepsin-like aspartic protease [Brachymonas sp. J145]NLX16831.1 clan AA aspartic protease [Ramlibacter sp.]
MPPPSVARTARLGTVWILLFWLLLGAGLYYVFQLQEQRQQDRYQSYTNSVGELVIPRSPDGHFYVKGEINGEPLRFMVDTGASMVVVSDAFADRAGLQGGARAIFQTANGERPGRVLRDVPVLAGGLSHSRTEVGIGLIMDNDDFGLLGQSFLSQFDLLIQDRQMVLRPRGNSR